MVDCIHHMSAQPLCTLNFFHRHRVTALFSRPWLWHHVVTEGTGPVLRCLKRWSKYGAERAVGSHFSVTGWPPPQDIFILNCPPSRSSVREPLSHSSLTALSWSLPSPNLAENPAGSPFRQIQNLSACQHHSGPDHHCPHWVLVEASSRSPSSSLAPYRLRLTGPQGWVIRLHC